MTLQSREKVPRNKAAERIGSSNCLAKTQVYANRKVRYMRADVRLVLEG